MENFEHNPIDPSELEEKDYSEFLMTGKEYAELDVRPRPYKVELKSGEKSLVFFGPGHFSDPENPAFKEIAQDIETIKPDLVLVEGIKGIEIVNSKDPVDVENLKQSLSQGLTNEDLLRRNGENAYTAKLAIDNGIEVRSPEPNEVDMVNFALENGASREAVFIEVVATLLHQYHWLSEKPEVEEYLAPFLDKLEKSWGWDNFDFSYDNFKDLSPKVINKEFDLNDREVIQFLADPIPWPGYPFTVVNKAAELRNLYRDKYIVKQIKEALKTHNKIYAVYGTSHVIMQEPALRKMMEDEK